MGHVQLFQTQELHNSSLYSPYGSPYAWCHIYQYSNLTHLQRVAVHSPRLPIVVYHWHSPDELVQAHTMHCDTTL